MPWEITLMRVNGRIINQKDMEHNNFKESLSMMDSSKMGKDMGLQDGSA